MHSKVHNFVQVMFIKLNNSIIVNKVFPAKFPVIKSTKTHQLNVALQPVGIRCVIATGAVANDALSHHRRRCARRGRRPTAVVALRLCPMRSLERRCRRHVRRAGDRLRTRCQNLHRPLPLRLHHAVQTHRHVRAFRARCLCLPPQPLHLLAGARQPNAIQLHFGSELLAQQRAFLGVLLHQQLHVAHRALRQQSLAALRVRVQPPLDVVHLSLEVGQFAGDRLV